MWGKLYSIIDTNIRLEVVSYIYPSSFPYITEEKICKHLYCPWSRKFVQKEVIYCNISVRTKSPNKKYVRFPYKLAEEIPCNKLFIDIIDPYTILKKEKKKDPNLKVIIMIYPVMGWFKIMEYNLPHTLKY